MINLGNVVGLIRSTTAPTKKYVLWGKILNPSFPDIVDVHYWDAIAAAWVPVTDPTTQYWLRPVLDNEITTPPSSPTEGDRYLIPAGATGTWAGHVDQVGTWKSGAWVYQTPLDGFIVSVRTQANTLYDYRGLYGAGGVWAENDFQTGVAPNQYIPTTEKGFALGVAPLDENTYVNAVYINGQTLPFSPAVEASWPGGTNTVASALNYLVTQIGIGGGGGGGTVTEVTISGLSPLFTAAVATATTVPAISFALQNQTANQVLAGPTSGGAAAPSFRALVGSDIPTGIDASKISSGILDIARIPVAAIERVFVYSGGATLPEAAGLTISQVQNGDILKMQSTGLMYVIANDAALNNAASFVGFAAGTAASVPWTGITGKPTFYYQTIAADEGDLTQRAKTLFTNGLTAYDESSTTKVRFGGYFDGAIPMFLSPTVDNTGTIYIGQDETFATNIATLYLSGYQIAMQAQDTLDIGAPTLSLSQGTALNIGSGIGVIKFLLGSDSTGDMFYRNASGNFTRLPIGADKQVIKALGSPRIPTWSNNNFIGLSDVPTAYTSSAGYLVRVNAGATGLEFVAPTTGGTVTTFSAGNLSPLFTTSVGAPTSAPALSFTAVSQTANKVYASPDGSSGVPTFRTMALGDLPQIATNSVWGRSTSGTGPLETLALGLGIYAESGFLKVGSGTVSEVIWRADSDSANFGMRGVRQNKISFTTTTTPPATTDLPQSAAGHLAFSMRKDDTDNYSFTEIVNKGDTLADNLYARFYILSRAADTTGGEFGTPTGILNEVRAEALGTSGLVYLKSGGKIKIDTQTNATGDMYYRDASGWFTPLGIGTNGQAIISNGTIPTWGAVSSSGHIIYNSGSALTQRAGLNFLNGLTAQDEGSGPNRTAIGLGGTLTSNTIFTGTTFNMIFNTNNTVYGGLTVETSALVNYISTSKAVLYPRVSTESNITTPLDGMVYYNPTELDFKTRINGQWTTLTRPGPRTDEVGTTYTLVESDRNKFIVFTNSGSITVTLPQSSLSAGFTCMLVRGSGAGTITITTAGTLQSAGTVMTATNGWISVIYKGSSTWLAAGAFGSSGGGSGGGITNGATNNELMKSDGTNATVSGLFVPSAGNINLGSDALTNRTISATGSGSNVSLTYTAKGTGNHYFYGSTATNVSFFAPPANDQFSSGLGVIRVYVAANDPDTTPVADVFYIWAQDSGAGGTMTPHFRNEQGHIIKLFRSGGTGWDTTGYAQTKALDMETATARDVANYALTMVEEILKPLGFCAS